MAEIKIQEKKASIWPWIIGLLLLAAIIYFIVYYMDTSRTADDGVYYLNPQQPAALMAGTGMPVMKGESYG